MLSCTTPLPSPTLTGDGPGQDLVQQRLELAVGGRQLLRALVDLVLEVQHVALQRFHHALDHALLVRLRRLQALCDVINNLDSHSL